MKTDGLVFKVLVTIFSVIGLMGLAEELIALLGRPLGMTEHEARMFYIYTSFFILYIAVRQSYRAFRRYAEDDKWRRDSDRYG